MPEVLDAMIERIPSRPATRRASRALVFDSSYDQYRGVVAFVRVVDGHFETREPLRAMAQGTTFEAEELGVMSPACEPVASLGAGEVGYVVTGLKDVSGSASGDTLTSRRRPARGRSQLPGRQADGLRGDLPDGLRRLPGASRRARAAEAQRRGALIRAGDVAGARLRIRCGFLGLLHMEIVRERLEREFDLDLLITAPTVAYRASTRAGEYVEVHNPAEMPSELEEVEEPYVKASMIVPKEYVGRRKRQRPARKLRSLEYLSEERVCSPRAAVGEIVLDFYDSSSRDRGTRASTTTSQVQGGGAGPEDILVGGEQVDALSLIIHRDFAYERGRQLVSGCVQESRGRCSTFPSRLRSARG